MSKKALEQKSLRQANLGKYCKNNQIWRFGTRT